MIDRTSTPNPDRLFCGSTVMVSGGCGFIGSHLVRKLLSLGAKKVFVVDSLRYGKRENLEDAEGPLEILPFCIGPDAIGGLASQLAETDYLFHLAAEKHNQSKDTPAAVIDANITGTHDLFFAAARHGVRKILFSSSLYAYGQMTAPSMSEDDIPRPWTVYGISKLAGEHLLGHVRRASGVQGVSLRYFFVYGPRQFANLGYKSVIVKNFERIVSNQAPLICGDGEQALDYIYVDDVVDATLLALANAPDGAVYNVGSGVALSINELTAQMCAVSGTALKPQKIAADWTAGSCRVANTTRIKQELGWSPQVSLEEGLRRTLAWVKEDALSIDSDRALP